MKRLNNKKAVITGGSRGIGLAIARSYTQAGAQVMIADVNPPTELSAAEQETIIYQQLDVTSQDSIDATVAAALKQMGGIDVLVNGAAVFDLCPTVEITRASYHKMFAVNLEGLIFMSQAVAKQMIAQNQQDPERRGKIINFSSQAGRRGEPLVAVYCASKAAVISITQSFALDLIKHKINVNGIAPGVVDTPMWEFVDARFAKYENLKPGEKKRQVGEGVPYGRMGKPEDLVGAALFLASSESDYVVAQTFNIDGGQWMS